MPVVPTCTVTRRHTGMAACRSIRRPSLPAPTGPPPPGSRTVAHRRRRRAARRGGRRRGRAAHRRPLARLHRPARGVGAAARRPARPGPAGALGPARARPLRLDAAARRDDRPHRPRPGPGARRRRPDRAGRARRPLDGRHERHGAGPAAARAVRRPRRRGLPAGHLGRRAGRDRRARPARSSWSAGCGCCRSTCALLQLVAPVLERFRRRGSADRPLVHPPAAVRARTTPTRPASAWCRTCWRRRRTRWRRRSTRRSSTTTRRPRSTVLRAGAGDRRRRDARPADPAPPTAGGSPRRSARTPSWSSSPGPGTASTSPAPRSSTGPS